LLGAEKCLVERKLQGTKSQTTLLSWRRPESSKSNKIGNGKEPALDRKVHKSPSAPPATNDASRGPVWKFTKSERGSKRKVQLQVEVRVSRCHALCSSALYEWSGSEPPTK
jgi:hypothetical protein